MQLARLKRIICFRLLLTSVVVHRALISASISFTRAPS